jgi:hypothetical protein
MKPAVIAGLIFACSPVPVSAADTPLQVALLHRYESFTRALQHHDAKFFDKYLAADFSAKLPVGPPVGREQTIKAFTDLMDGTKGLQWTWKVAEPSIGPQGALVITDGVMTGKVKADNAWHKIEIKGRTEDTWSFGQWDWQLRRVRFLNLTVKADGKEIPPPPGIFGTAPGKG